MNDKLELIRAEVRPFITKWLVIIWSLVTVFLVVASVLGGNMVEVDAVPNTPYEVLTGITATAFGWYFVKREIEKRKGG